MQIINDPYATFSGGMGNALSQGLQQLASMKMQELQQRHQHKIMEKQAIKTGFTPQAARLLALTPEKNRQSMMAALIEQGMFNQEKPGAQPIGNQVEGMQPDQQSYQQMPMQGLMQPSSEQIFGGQPQQQGQAINPYSTLQNILGGGIRSELMQQPQMQQPQMQQQQGMQQQPPRIPPTHGSIAEAIKSAALSPGEKIQQQRLGVEKQRLELSQKKEEEASERRNRLDKKAYLETNRERAERSRENKQRYKNIIKVAQSGSLRAGTMQGVLEKLKMGNFWRNPQTEEAQSEINMMATGVGAAYGKIGRILGKEFESYRDGLIRTWNTPAGMVAISRNQMLKDDINELRYETQKNIIKQNNNKVPVNIEDIIDDTIAPQLKVISQKMDRNFSMAMQGQMPTWKDKKYNPALYEEGTVAKINGIPWEIKDGMWDLAGGV